jgi:hypothetical protein
MYSLLWGTIRPDTTLGINLMLLLKMISGSRSTIVNEEFLLVLSNRTLVAVVHLFLIPTSNVSETVPPDL